jgi:hypothetical protein
MHILVHIYIAGYDGSTQLSSCLSYVPSLNKWVDMPSLNVARCLSTLSVWKGIGNDSSIHFTILFTLIHRSFLFPSNILLSFNSNDINGMNECLNRWTHIYIWWKDAEG